MEASTEPRTDPPESGNGTNVGHIEEIQGVVIEASFPADRLPEINHALEIERPEATGGGAGGRQLGHEQARPRGPAAPRRRPRPRGRHGHHRRALARGMEVVDTGGPITVPVGEAVLGPDLQPARRDDRPGRAGRDRGALADPPARADGRGPHADDRDVRDRHQGRRPARALRQGRQGRPVRRRRGRQDGAHPGADPQHRRGARAACRRSAAWASAPARATTCGSR